MSHEENIEKAIEYFKNEYAKCANNIVIHNPIAYALYQTWKHYDRQTKNRTNDMRN